VVLVIGILLFGRRLPDIGRTLGKSLVEFKKGMLARNPGCELCQRENVANREAPDAPGQLAEHIRCECGRLVCPRHICHKRCDSCGLVMCGGCVQMFSRALPDGRDSLGRPKPRREILHYCPECYKAA
jgi:hypothetical protein